MKQQGVLIAFEGIDGTGKSSQLQQLADFLEKNGHEVVRTFEPTDGPYGQKIRKLFTSRSDVSLEEELDLFVSDRRQHVSQLITPALSQGKIVLTDRYYFSTAAYQGAAGYDPQKVFAMHDFAPEPDLVVLLTMDPALSQMRIKKLRGDALNDFEQQEQLTRVAELFASFSQKCITRINADRPFDKVQEDIRKRVTALLEERM